MTPALVLLRAVPVLTTSSSLTFTFCEDLFLRPHLNPVVTAKQHVNGVLPPYVSRWFPRGFAYILIFYPATWAAGIANLAVRTASMHPYVHDVSSPNLAAARAAWGLYAAGLAFSLAHFGWGIKAKGFMDTIAQDKPEAGAAGARNTNSDVEKNGSKVGGADPTKDHTVTLRSWLRLNAIRGISVDIPAWACFFVGFLLSVGY